MELKTGSIAFGRDKGVSPRTATQDETFDRNVTQATAVLTGADFGFSPRDDHHLGEVVIKVDANVLGNIVRVTASLGVRDWSGDVDDDYEGTVFYAVVAELA
jgi:hypothetical protein